MARRKVKVEQRILLGLLLVFACVLLGTLRSLGLLGRRTPPANSLSGVSAVPGALQRFHERMGGDLPEEPLASAKSVGAGAPVQYTSSELRDPLVSLVPENKPVEQPVPEPVVGIPVGPPPQPPAVTVQGMIWGGARPQVLIDSQLYNVGDTVQGARIVSIGREGVTVAIQGATFLLSPVQRLGMSAAQPHDAVSSTRSTSPTPFVVDHGR